MTPALIVEIFRIAAPIISQLIINRYERHDNLTPEQQAHLDAHKAFLAAVKPPAKE